MRPRVHHCVAVIARPIIHFLRVPTVFLKTGIAGVGRRDDLRFSDVIHVLLQGILYFVVLTLALSVVLARLQLHLGVLVAGLLRLVVTLREAALRAAAVGVPVGGTAALVATAVQVVFARLLRQVLALVLREGLVL